MTAGEIFQALGNLGEFVGAIAVVVTFILLVRQLRESSELIKESNLQAQIDRSIGHSRFIVGTPGMMALYQRGMNNPESLSQVERMRFGTFLFGMFQDFQVTYHLHNNSRAASFYWQNQRHNMLSYVRQPGGRDWWDNGGKRTFHADFVAYVDAELEAGVNSC